MMQGSKITQEGANTFDPPSSAPPVPQPLPNLLASAASSLDERFPIRSAASFLQDTSQPVEMIVPDFIERGSLTLLTAPPSSGKTAMLMLVAIAVATGSKVADTLEAKKGRVLFAGFEASGYQYGKQFRRILAGQQMETCAVDFACLGGLDLRDEVQWRWLRQKVEDGQYDLVLIDGLRALSTAEENSNTEMDVIMTRLVQLTGFGCTVIVTHHKGKPGDVFQVESMYDSRGASCIPARCDAVWHVRLDKDSGSLVLKCMKSRGEIEQGHEIGLTMAWDKMTISFAPALQGLVEVVARVLRDAGDSGVIRKRVVEAVSSERKAGEKPETFEQRVDRALTALVKTGKVRHGGQGSPYVWVSEGGQWSTPKKEAS
jgi:hypothetical protein